MRDKGDVFAAQPPWLSPLLSSGRPVTLPHGWPWLAGGMIVTLAVLMPLLTLLVLAMRGSGGLWPHLAAYVLPQAARDTMILLAGVAFATSTIGVGTAWLTAACRFPFSRVFDWALLLPMAMPAYIVAYTYLDFLHPLGPVQGTLRALSGISSPADLWFPSIRSMGGCITLMGFVLYPYVYLSARAMFLMQSACVLDVARTLGCGPWRTFWRVAVPLAHPAIAVGVSLAMMEALNDLGAVEFLGVRTLTVSIYSTWTNRTSLEGAAQIALFMLAIVAILLMVERWARRHQRYAANAQRSRMTIRAQLSGWRAACAFTACLLPVLIGFAIPASYLAYQGWRVLRHTSIPPHIWNEALHSITFATGGALLTLCAGLVLAYAMRTIPSPLPRMLARVSSLGYAIPGTVLAVGLLMPMAAFDNAIDSLARDWFGISTGLLITGTGGALILAYAIRFMAIAVGGLETGYGKIPPTLDAAARNLGEKAPGVVWRIHIPLLRPALFSAALLVFVDCMKELPATLMLRPFNFETLSTHVYMEASRGTYEDGSVAALLIVAVGLLPVVLLARAARPARASD
jgi:iron(III) transport system permease protein